MLFGTVVLKAEHHPVCCSVLLLELNLVFLISHLRLCTIVCFGDRLHLAVTKEAGGCCVQTVCGLLFSD